MDIHDIYEGEATQTFVQTKSTGKRALPPVDDMHPFDLETYISGYSRAERGSMRAGRAVPVRTSRSNIVLDVVWKTAGADASRT